MNTIKQNKLLIIIVILLLAVNVGTISTIWLSKSKQTNERTYKKKFIKSKYKHKHKSHNYFVEELNLSEEQKGFYIKLKKEHFSEMHTLRDSIRLCKKSINKELFNVNPDKAYINELADSIGKMNARFERANYKHFLEIKSILSDEQLEKFKHLIDDASCDSRKDKSHRGRR